MADNVVADAGSGGATFATDDIGSVHYPRNKVVWGADGTANDTDAASGKALPIQGEAAENAATTGNPVLTGGRYDATPRTLGDGDVGAIALDADGAIQISDGGNAITVDGTVTVTHPQVGGGTESGAQRVTIANDSTGVISVDDNGAALTVDNGGTFAVQVDNNPVLGAGSNNIGDVDIASAIPAGDNNIGNVDIVTLPNEGQQTMANSISVAIANDQGSIGTVQLEAGSSSIGTLGANSGVDIGDVDVASIAAGDNNIGNVDIQLSGTGISGGSGVVDSGTLRVTLATDIALPAGANAIGKLAANDGVDIGDVTLNNATIEIVGDAAHDAAVSGNPVLQGGEARQTLSTAVADGDAVRSMYDDHGRQVIAPHSPRDLTTHNRLALTSTSETTLIAAGGSGVYRDLVFLSMSNESATEVRVDIRDSTTGTIRFSMDLAEDGGGCIVPFTVPLTQATANNNWTAQLSAAVSTVYITAIAIDNQ